jgi:hypothetical protein
MFEQKPNRFGWAFCVGVSGSSSGGIAIGRDLSPAPCALRRTGTALP